MEAAVVMQQYGPVLPVGNLHEVGVVWPPAEFAGEGFGYGKIFRFRPARDVDASSGVYGDASAALVGTAAEVGREKQSRARGVQLDCNGIRGAAGIGGLE